MLTFRTVVLWIHVAGVVVWIGGMILLPFLVVPAVRRLLPERGSDIAEAIVRRFLRVSRELVFAVLLSGIFNVINTGWLTDFAYRPGYLEVVGAKFVLLLGMAANQAWYGRVLLPQGKMRVAAWACVGNAVLAATVLYLALTLRYG